MELPTLKWYRDRGRVVRSGVKTVAGKAERDAKLGLSKVQLAKYMLDKAREEKATRGAYQKTLDILVNEDYYETWKPGTAEYDVHPNYGGKAA